MKNKWVGICGICGAKDQQLSTTKTSLTSKDGGITYTTRRACDHCQQVLRYQIDHTMLILVADRKHLEKIRNDMLEGVLE